MFRDPVLKFFEQITLHLQGHLGQHVVLQELAKVVGGIPIGAFRKATVPGVGYPSRGGRFGHVF